MALKYAELISRVSVGAGVSMEVADKVFKSFTNVISSDILEVGKITIPRLLTIEAVEVGERKGTLNSKEWVKPAHTTARISLSDVLKASVEEKSNPALIKKEKEKSE